MRAKVVKKTQKRKRKQIKKTNVLNTTPAPCRPGGALALTNAKGIQDDITILDSFFYIIS